MRSRRREAFQPIPPASTRSGRNALSSQRRSHASTSAATFLRGSSVPRYRRNGRPAAKRSRALRRRASSPPGRKLGVDAVWSDADSACGVRVEPGKLPGGRFGDAGKPRGPSGGAVPERQEAHERACGMPLRMRDRGQIVDDRHDRQGRSDGRDRERGEEGVGLPGGGPGFKGRLGPENPGQVGPRNGCQIRARGRIVQGARREKTDLGARAGRERLCDAARVGADARLRSHEGPGIDRDSHFEQFTVCGPPII